MNETVWIIASLLLALAGAAITWLGWRGRRVGDHPICRRCGFDLFGLPDGVATCSECGANLSAPGAIRIGHRRKLGRVLAAGILLLLLAGSLTTLIGVTRWGDFEINVYKPVWLLAREAGSDDAALRDAAMKELSARLKGGKLNPQQVTLVLDNILAWQADANRTWVPLWGNLFQAARASGLVPDEKWKQYALNSTQATMEIRPVLRRGEALPYWLGRTPGRVGQGRRDELRAQWEIKGVTIGGKRIRKQRHGGSGMEIDIWGGRTSGSQIEINAKDFADIPNGPTTVAVEVEQEFYQARPQWPGTLLGKRTTTITLRLEIVPADAETVKVVKDAALREAVEKSLVISSWHFSASNQQPVVFIEDDKQVSFSIQANNSTIGLAYDVYLKTPQREWKMGTASFPKGKTGGWGLNEDVKDMPGFAPDRVERVDIVLRPSVKVALNTIDILEMWDGEVMFQDVPVQRVLSPEKAATTRKAPAATVPPE
jgi:hypothetical protein